MGRLSQIGMALVVAFMTAVVACQSGSDEDPRETLRRHYDEVIRPETAAPLAPIAESCENGDTDACQTYGVLRGEMAMARLARYWEAMRWLGVDEPGDEVLPELVAVGDDCDYLAQLYAINIASVSGMCSYFRTYQLPYDPEPSEPTPKEGNVSQERILTAQSLRNATYHFGQNEIALVDGHYEAPIEGTGFKETAWLQDDIAFGDLNGDGAEDAAAVLAFNGGGSGTFMRLFAVLNQDGKAEPLGETALGDRIIVNSLSVVDGEIEIQMVVQDDDDPLCCPSLEVTRRYELQGGQLVEQ